MISKKYLLLEDEDSNDSLTSSSRPCPGGRATTAVMNFLRRMRFNKAVIQCWSDEMLEVENGARNVTGLDGFVSLGKSSVTKKEF